MATVDSAVPIRAQTRSERLVRALTRTPLHIALVGIALAAVGPELPLVAEQRRGVDEGGDLVEGDALHDLGAEERWHEHRVVQLDLGGAGR